MNQLNDDEIATGIEILKYIEMKKEIGASSLELLVNMTNIIRYLRVKRILIRS